MTKKTDVDDMLSAVKTELPRSSVPNQPDEIDIAARAYEIYESNGRIAGNDLSDWLQAERELTNS